MAMMCLMMPAFVSCDKDDDDDKQADVDHVVGTYTGTMTATVSAMGQVWDNIDMPDGYVVKITKKDNSSNKVTVEIPQCSYTPPMSEKVETIPALTINDVEVESIGNGMYSLDKDDCTIPIDGVQYKVEIYDYDKDDTHREDGTTISGRYIRLVYSVVPGKMPGNINFTFTGTLN